VKSGAFTIRAYRIRWREPRWGADRPIFAASADRAHRARAIPFPAPFFSPSQLPRARFFPFLAKKRYGSIGQFFYERKFLFHVTISLAAQQHDD
jgi:hypothetical protein